MRILIIDDHPDTAETISMVLSAIGHETDAEHTGRAGLAAVETFRPDLVILDIGLPDISGYDVARAIRELPRGRQLYVVAATGWGTAEDRVLALAAGFDHHILKPVDLDKLEVVIKAATARINSVPPVATDPA